MSDGMATEKQRNYIFALLKESGEWAQRSMDLDPDIPGVEYAQERDLSSWDWLQQLTAEEASKAIDYLKA